MYPVIGSAQQKLSALVAHPDVAEAAVVGYPHDIKGRGIYCYITLNAGLTGDDDLKKTWAMGPQGNRASCRLIFFNSLPAYLKHVRQNLRRILRKIAEDDFSNLGDTSTLADQEGWLRI